MMKFLILLSILFAFVSCKEDVVGQIVGGKDADIYKYPFMAAILNFGWPYCGGTIINQRSVLTAAHCILVNTPLAISIGVGSSRRQGQGGETYRTSRLIIHPEYLYQPDPFIMRKDLAVIRTLRTIRFGIRVQPLPLGRSALPSGASVIIAGWGLLGDSQIRDRADQLQQLNMQVMSNIACILRFIRTEAHGLVTSEMVCLTAPNGAGGCSGDSGGPILWQGTIAGIASWTLRPCGSHPTVYIRVSEHINWIERNM